MDTNPSQLWRWTPLGLILASLLLGFSIWEPLPPGIWHDDGVYVLLGRSLAEGEGLRYVGVPGAPLAPKFPPLFPALLGIVWLVFPSFPENASILGSVNLILTSVAGGIFFHYMRRALDLPAPVALLVTALAWASAHLWRVAFVPLSEPLFLLFLLLALHAGGRMEGNGGGSEKGPTGALALFLLLGGLAVYARTLGVAVLIAGIVSCLLSGKRREAIWLAFGSAALLLPWVIWSGGAAETIPDPLLDVLGPYGTWLASQMVSDPWGFCVFALRNLLDLLARIATLTLPGVPGPQLLYGILVAPLILLGLWQLWGRSRLLPLTLVFSMGIILVWPFREIRLMVPFQPLLFLALVMGIRRILPESRQMSRLRRPVLVMAGAWCLFFLSTSIFRLASGWTLDSYKVRAAALMDAVRAVSEHTPDDAVVGAPELWAGIHLFTDREVVPSAPFRPLAEDSPVYGRPEQQYEIWVRTGVSHVLVEHGGKVHGDALDRMDAECPPGTIRVLDVRAGRVLVALEWDEACQRQLLQGSTGDRSSDSGPGADPPRS
jgi:hypothetical protein